MNGFLVRGGRENFLFFLAMTKTTKKTKNGKMKTLFRIRNCGCSFWKVKKRHECFVVIVVVVVPKEKASAGVFSYRRSEIGGRSG